jgi:serine/threonine protein kinase
MNASARWDRVGEVFARALDATAGPDRDALIARETTGDDALRDEVERLVRAHARPGAADRFERILRDVRRQGGPVAGESIGPYVIVERIASGGMGIVFAARESAPGAPVRAVKLMPSLQALDPEARRRFLREAEAAARLSHPNIGPVIAFAETDDGRPYIVMPLHEGETIAERVARGALPAEEALRVAIAVAEALAHAHARGVIHRDVKPSNILLLPDGSVRLLDFGIARIVDARITASGAVLGTLPYMSPEQALGRGVDHRTDLWSLGVVLHEMIAGVRHFRDADTVAAITAIRSGETPRLTVQRGAREVNALLERFLAREPSARFADAEAAIAAMTAARSAIG